MKIKTIPISKIRPAKYNPRRDLQPGDEEYEKIKRSIEEFELVEPLVWNKRTGNLVGGHQRLKILKEQGVKEVEVSVVDLDDAREKALNIALNKVQGEWDNIKLHEVFLELEELDFDLDITGFDVLERELIHNEAEPEEPIDPPVPPLPKKPKSKRGDLFLLGNHRLLCGDATDRKDVKRLLCKDVKIDMVFTDPPYGIDIVNDGTIGGKEPPLRFKGKVGIDSPVGFKGKVRIDSVVKAGIYPKVIGDEKPFDPTHLLNLADRILIFGGNNFTDKLPAGSHWLVWDKKCGVGADRNKFSDAELIWTNIDRKSCNIYRCLWSGLLREGRRDIELAKRVHPTQKPVKLYYDILKDYSEEGNIILDPYGGSGSLMMACEQLNRACYMMEISEAYTDVILARWEALTGKKARKIK